MINRDIQSLKPLSNLSSGRVVMSVNDLFTKEGTFYNVFATSSLASNAYLDIGLYTGNNFHNYEASNLVTTADNVTLSVYELSTLTGGTILTTNSRNRNILNIPAKTIFKSNVSITSTGTLLFQTFVGGSTGVGQSRSGGSSSGLGNSILIPNTSYLIRIFNGSSETNKIHVNWDWYETSV